MDTGSETSVSLLERISDDPGDEQAWREFVDRYGPKIYAWCRYWRLQEADAEDVTQGLLLKLVDKLSDFEYDPGKGSFRGWLKTLSHHAWYDFPQDRIAREGDRGTGDHDVYQQLLSTPAYTSLLQRLQDEFDLELLDTAKQRVRSRVAPHTWKAYCRLVDDGASAKEVSAETGLKVAMVYVARSKVKKMLREEIERLEQDREHC